VILEVLDNRPSGGGSLQHGHHHRRHHHRHHRHLCPFGGSSCQTACTTAAKDRIVQVL